MKVAAYLRVSSKEQDLENQLPAMESIAQRLGGEIVQVYQEQESAWKAGH